MTRLGRLELYFGRIVPVEEVLAGIDAVTLDDVHRLCAQVLDSGRHAIAAIGPFENPPDFSV
jgi:predicted Zn-dependent peptidase